MKVIINRSVEPYFNLAAEEYLLENAPEPLFLLWRSEPSVVIGKNQNAFAEVDLEFARARGIKVVRRLTGGGAVFHDLGNLNYTFITERDGGIDFARFTSPIIDALSSLGVDARLSGRNDLVVPFEDGERKFSGSAQCAYSRSDGGEMTLHHGTLLVSADLSRMQGVLKPDPEKLTRKGIKSVRSRVVNLGELIEGLDSVGLCEILTDFAAKRFGAEVLELTDAQISGISELAQSKYSTDAWNLMRMGDFESIRSRRFDFGRVSAALDVKDGRIAEIAFTGDFFGARDIRELERRLIGVAFMFGEIETAIADVGEFIAGATADEVAAMLCGENLR